MAQQLINVGASANDRSGDPLRTAFTKVNTNFTDLYNQIGIIPSIPSQTGNGGLFLATTGTSLVWAAASGGGGASLPLQTGNSGKFLTTDGTNATWSAPIIGAGTLTGTILANNVVTSSLTSVGTLASLIVSGNTSVGGNLSVTGNLNVNGSITTVNQANLTVSNSLIYLAQGNTTNALDIGMLGTYNTNKYAGLVKHASDGYWYLFSNDADTITTTINPADITKDTLIANLIGNVTGNVTGTVTNGVYTTGSYSDPSWITSLSPTKVLPAQTVGLSGYYLTTNGTTASWTALSVPTASTTVLGSVKVDGTSITINNGVISTIGTLPSVSGNSGKYLTTDGTTVSWGTINTVLAGISVASSNGFSGSISSGTITVQTTVTGILRGNGSVISAATAGVDFQTPIGTISGIVKGNGANALTAATAGVDYQSAQSVTGIVKSSGTTRSAAVVGTDYSAGTASLATGIVKSTTTTGALSIALAGTDYIAPYGLTSGNYVLAAPNGSAGTPSFRAMVVADLSNLGTNVPTFLTTPSSANLSSALTDKTGTGVNVFGTSPAITTSLTTASTSFDLLNTTATTVNFAGAGTSINIGASTGTTTVNNNLTVSGTLTVNGTTEYLNSTTLQVLDKNIEIGKVVTPTDTTADGGGITLKGATDKTINWDLANTNWTSSENWNIATGKVFKINNVSVLSATTLGSAVVNSSLTSVGTIGTGVWNGTLIGATYGGTGVNNGANTLTLAGNVTHAGAYTQTFTATGITSVTLPTTGTLATLAGSEALTNKTVNKVTITAPATGSTLTILDGKTFTVNNTVTLAGTDSTTITLPATTGTVALNNQTFYIGSTSVAINRTSASLALTGITSIDGYAANLAGGNATTQLGAIHYQSNTNVTSLLAPNTTTTKKFLRQTGDGTNGAVPAWDTLIASDIPALSYISSTASQTANFVLAAPNGSAGAPTFRALVTTDIPGTLGATTHSGSVTLNGSANLVFTGSTSGTVTFTAGVSPAVQSYTLPSAYPGLTGYVLSSTTGGVLSWVAAGVGTVTSVSVASANGFTGTVATSTSTPAITITTSISGMLKGNGTALSAATSGTDYAPGTSALATGIVKSTTTTGALSIATSGTDYAPGTSALATGIVKSTTTTGALTIAAAADINSTFGSQTQNYFYAAPNGSAGTPSFRALVGADIPSSLTAVTNLGPTVSVATLTIGGAIDGNTLKVSGTAGGTINYTTDVTSGIVNAWQTVSGTTNIASSGSINLGTSTSAATTVKVGGAIDGNILKIAGTTTGTASAITTDVTTGTVSILHTGLTGTLNIGGAATTITIGNTATAAQTVNLFTASTGASTYNFATGATANATTKAINIGTAGVSGSTTNITIGSTVSGATSTLTFGGAVADATAVSTAKSVGYLGLPQSATATSATLAIGDAGKHIYVNTASQTMTIPANSSVSYPIGTTITFIAGPSATTVSIAITTDTMYLAGAGTTGTRTLAAYGMATAVKVAATTWYINGTGLT